MAKRKNKMRASLGESWGDASLSSHDSVSPSTSEVASEIEFEESDKSDKDTAAKDAVPTTPRPATKGLSTSHPQISPSKKATPDRGTARRLQTSENTPRRKSQDTPKAHQTQTEPSFIMPTPTISSSATLDRRPSEGGASPQRNSQVRSRTIARRTQRRQTKTPPPRPSPQKPQPLRSEPRSGTQQERGPWHYVGLVAWPLVQYFGEVLAYAMRHFIKPLLGVALGVSLLWVLATAAMGFFRHTVTTALSPVCIVPGSSFILPFCATLSQPSYRADFEELVNVQSHFEEILDASKDTSTLPSTIKDSELAIRDLRTLVRHSRLPSRHQLDLEFENFVLTANEASVDLSRYNSRIGATMDRVIATNTWTLAVLNGISSSQTSLLSRALSTLTSPFTPPPLSLQQRIFDQYLLHVTKNKEEITRLITTATALLTVLQNLDARLDTIHSIALTDDATIARTQDELLASLWTKLGANSRSVKANSQHLTLLRHVTAYRRKALEHVSATLLKLREIQAELENLRERVAAPEVLGWRDEVPLEYHLELIERGVERLRVARGEAERVEGENLRRAIRGGSEGVKEVGGGAGAGKEKVVTVKAK